MPSSMKGQRKKSHVGGIEGGKKETWVGRFWKKEKKKKKNWKRLPKGSKGEAGRENSGGKTS